MSKSSREAAGSAQRDFANGRVLNAKRQAVDGRVLNAKR